MLGARERGTGVYTIVHEDPERARNDAAWPRRSFAAGQLADSVLGKLGTQGVAVQSQHVRRLRLIAAGAVHDGSEQRALDVGDDHGVDAVGRFPVQPAEIIFQGFLDAAADFVGAVKANASLHAARASSTHGAAVVVAAGVNSSRSARAASRSKNRLTAAICAAGVSSRLNSSRNATPPLRPLAYQPRCLRAMRTPVSSP